ncbi:AAA family ATPase [Thermocrinis minervae]|uniref:Exonuclease SbcC n=1 Tax=Thermocrinis minervae TaxID=381751 RepID=A0A1M6QJR7_9AQUI|nr:SMC family ATPase [Thermocrinis minervae]SHK20491.1 exonuclease SbcC [Thermocrinis minervae]
MRPLRLTLEGFTTYKKKQTIDFSNLEFFLIQGKTGAGKTSLLDAMCYALFGRVPRYSQQLPHEEVLSKGSDKVYVEFKFSVKGKEYEVVRYYSRITGRGEVRFYEQGKPLNLKAKQVEERISQILGMGYDVFTKVLVLPQGQFDRFLKPQKQTERRDILNRLIGYEEVLKKLSDRVSQEYHKLEQEIEYMERELEELKSYTVDLYEEKKGRLEETVEAIRQMDIQLRDIQEKLSHLEEIKRKLDELNDLRSKFSLLESRKDEVESLKERIERVEKAKEYESPIKQFKWLSSKLEDLNRQEKELSIKVEKLRSLLEEEVKAFQRYEEEYVKLKEYRKVYDELLQKKEKWERHTKIRNELSTLQLEIHQLKQEILKLEEQISQHASQLDAKKQKIEDLNQSIQEEAELLTEYRLLTSTKTKLENLRKQKEELVRQIDKLQQELSGKEKSLIERILESLRESYRSTGRCLVCGRVEDGHTNLEDTHVVQVDTKLVMKVDEDRNKLEKLKASLERLQEEEKGLLKDLPIDVDKLEEHYQKIVQRLSKIKEDKQTLKTLTEEYEILSHLKAQLEKTLEAKRTALHEKLSRMQALQEEIKQLEDTLGNLTKTSLNQIEEEINNLKELIDTISNNYHEHLEKKNRLESDLKATISRLEEILKSKTSLEEQKLELSPIIYRARTEFGSLEAVEDFLKEKEKLEVWKKQVEDYITEYRTLEEKIKELSELTYSFDHELYNSIKEEYERLSQKHKELVEEKGRLEEQLNNISEKIKRRSELEGKYEKIRRRYELYRLLREDMKSNKFQDFVSKHMLRSVIDRANYYLEKFSPYEFRINNKEELVIYDKTVGAERSVYSLSGGETFLASISLAFGLADVVSDNSPLESMFIDEGFGSLDSETRDNLDDFFELIKQNSNRVVGIISHLEDLAEKFSQRIVVKKHGDYSTVEVYY